MFFRKAPKLQIGRLRPEAAAICAAIHAASFRHGWGEGEFAALLRDPSVVSAAALDPRSGDPVGFVLSRRALDEAEILSIAIAPKARGTGAGRLLLNHHIAQLTQAGVKSLYLEVEAGNAAALALYSRAGFKKVGERRGYYRTEAGPAATALILRRDAA